DLSEQEKQTIVALSQAVGALVGGMTGGNLGEALVGSTVAKNAAENNWLSKPEIEEANKALKACDNKGGDVQSCRKQIVDAMNTLDQNRDRELFDGKREIESELYSRLRAADEACGNDRNCYAKADADTRAWASQEYDRLRAGLLSTNNVGQLVLGGYYPDGKLSAMLDGAVDRAKELPGMATSIYDYLTGRGVGGMTSDAANGVKNITKDLAGWLTSDLPNQTIERKIDNLATMNANEVGGLAFDATLGTLTGYAGSQAIQLVAGKWVPLVGKVLDEFVDRKAEQSLLSSGGSHSLDGKPLLDFGSLTTDQKRVIGEIFGENQVKSLLPDGEKLARIQGEGSNGLDDLYKTNRPEVDYVVIEYKFGVSTLRKTVDGMQGSDGWLTGAITKNDRILDAVGNQDIADNIADSLRKGRVERWLVHTDENGGVSIGLLDANGKFIPQPRSKLPGVNGK
ncbi:VENN motif pre-toxin domain-containing protein, partial [Xanthomonas sacchari]